MKVSGEKSPRLFSVEAEQQVLGAVMNDNDLHSKVHFLRPDHFHDSLHGLIWKNICDRIAKGHMVSPVTLQADFVGHEGLQEVGGHRYLARVAGSVIASHAIAEYAAMLVEMADRRQIISVLDEAKSGIESGWDASRAAARLEMAIHERNDQSTDPRTVSFLRAQTAAIERMVEIQQGADPGVPSGLRDLDEAVSFAPGRYTILGGGTSMGKTGLALWLAYSAAKRGHGVGFVSLEMPVSDLTNRINSIESQVPYQAYDRQMSETLFRKVVETSRSMQDMPIQIFNDRVRDVPAILSEAQRLKRMWKPNGQFKGLRLLVVDYLQLVTARGESQFVRLSSVANDLKKVAKILDVHVIALAQVSRDLGKAQHWRESRPRLADLRGSGDLENAPDNVLFIFRPEYYISRSPKPKKIEELADLEAESVRWKNKAEIIIGKARMGAIGSVTVGCDMATNRFWDDDNQKEIEF